MCIITPILEIVGDNELDLSGKGCWEGLHALPGGHFTLIANEVINHGSLYVIRSGGQGKQGERGKAGKEGKNGANAPTIKSLEEFYKAKEDGFEMKEIYRCLENEEGTAFNVFAGIATFGIHEAARPNPERHIYYTINGKNGEDGGPAGPGGPPGNNSEPGKALVLNLKNNTKDTFKLNVVKPEV